MQLVPLPLRRNPRQSCCLPGVRTGPQTAQVQIKVFDVLGNEIETLVNEEKQSGTYEVEFNSHSGNVRNLPSGIYFYTLQTENYFTTKKMILLK